MDLSPEEMLLAAIFKRAIHDARNGHERLQREALQFLWTHAPSIAERAGLPGQNRFMNKVQKMGDITTI